MRKSFCKRTLLTKLSMIAKAYLHFNTLFKVNIYLHQFNGNFYYSNPCFQKIGMLWFAFSFCVKYYRFRITEQIYITIKMDAVRCS